MMNISFESFISSDMKDGQYACVVENGSLEIMLSGFDHSSNISYFMVGFNGAVSDREKKTPPFFSGLGLSNELQIPLLAISDPSLNMSDQCSIGWYAGNELIPNLPNIISELIVAVSERYNSIPILFGGSAGGYACLLQATLLPIQAKILVWNPQTNIYRYVYRFVLAYLKTAFPDTCVLAEQIEDSKMLSFLQRHLPHYSLIGKPIKDSIDILYFQNDSDWHLQDHALPYFFQYSLLHDGNGVYRNNTTTLQIGNWGNGHIPPPKPVLLRTIELMRNGYSSLDISHELVKEFDVLKTQKYYLPSIKDADKNYLEYKCVRKDNRLCIEVSFNGQPIPKEVQCAIYFIHKQERVKIVWYQQSSTFDITSFNFDFDAIQIFIKDVFGNLKHKYFKFYIE